MVISNTGQLSKSDLISNVGQKDPINCIKHLEINKPGSNYTLTKQTLFIAVRLLHRKKNITRHFKMFFIKKLSMLIIYFI